MSARRLDVPPLMFAVAVSLHFAALAFDLQGLRLATKPLPALALAWWTAATPLIAAGLVFSAAGDLALELGRETPFFLAGMAAFALAHAAYVAAFLARTRRLHVAAALPFLLWGMVLIVKLSGGLGPLLFPVSGYATLLVAMMWRASAASLESGRRDAAAGAVLFGASDSVIALDRFLTPVPGGSWTILVLYWAGQYLIARSSRP